MRYFATPLNVQMFLTSRCNLHCEHCFAEVFRGADKESELDTFEWKALLTRLHQIGVLQVLFSGGEVFERKDALDILAFAGTLRFPKKMLLTSNGVRIDDALARELRAIGFQSIEVSLDGTATVHDRIRGRTGCFDEAMAGISHLLANGIAAGVQLTLMRHNYSELVPLAPLLYRTGVRVLYLNQLQPQGRAQSQYEQWRLRREDYDRVAEEAAQIQQTYEGFKVIYQRPPYDSLPKMAKAKEGQPQCLKSCGAGHMECSVTPDGEVIPCSVLSDFRAGNVRRRDILDIWRNSIVMKEIRALNEVPVDHIEACKGCQYVSICAGGCRGTAYNLTGDLLAPDPDCPFWARPTPASAFAV